MITEHWEIQRFLPSWRELDELAETAGPFSAPDDLLAWAAVYLPRSATIHLVSLWQGDLLIAVAPMFRRSFARAGRFGRVASIHPLGNLHDPVIVELPEIVCRDGFAPLAMRELAAHFATSTGVLWTELPFTAAQGWPVLPSDNSRSAHAGVALVHKVVRPSVVLQIDPADWLPDLPRVKRNLRESLRRSRNRMRALDEPSYITWDTAGGASFLDALRDLKTLHGKRAALPGPTHEDVFGRPKTEQFLRTVGRTNSSADWAIGRLWIGDRPVAALLTVATPRLLWLSISGMDEVGADLSAVTWLQSEAIRRASLTGASEVAFSIGVDTAKLRWSEEVRSHHEFFLVTRTPFALAIFAAYQVVRTWRSMKIHRKHSRSLRREKIPSHQYLLKPGGG